MAPSLTATGRNVRTFVAAPAGAVPSAQTNTAIARPRALRGSRVLITFTSLASGRLHPDALRRPGCLPHLGDPWLCEPASRRGCLCRGVAVLTLWLSHRCDPCRA